MARKTAGSCGIILVGLVLFSGQPIAGSTHEAASGNRRPWVTPSATAPRVELHTFESKAAKTRVSFHMYTPENYEREPKGRFPVLYWLHGTGGGLEGIRPLSAFFDGAIREGKIPPMLIVYPNGLATSMWCDSKDGSIPMETVVVQELVPYVDRSFRTIATAEGRMIEGFSMGGYGAARLGFKYTRVFGSVSIFAGGPLDLTLEGPRARGNPAEREKILQDTFGGDLDYFQAQSPITIVKKNADRIRGRIRVRMATGSLDHTFALNRAYADLLDELRIPHTFEVVSGVRHDPLALLKGRSTCQPLPRLAHRNVAATPAGRASYCSRGCTLPATVGKGVIYLHRDASYPVPCQNSGAIVSRGFPVQPRST